MCRSLGVFWRAEQRDMMSGVERLVRGLSKILRAAALVLALGFCVPDGASPAGVLSATFTGSLPLCRCKGGFLRCMMRVKLDSSSNASGRAGALAEKVFRSLIRAWSPLVLQWSFDPAAESGLAEAQLRNRPASVARDEAQLRVRPGPLLQKRPPPCLFLTV